MSNTQYYLYLCVHTQCFSFRQRPLPSCPIPSTPSAITSISPYNDNPTRSDISSIGTGHTTVDYEEAQQLRPMLPVARQANMVVAGSKYMVMNNPQYRNRHQHTGLERLAVRPPSDTSGFSLEINSLVV